MITKEIGLLKVKELVTRFNEQLSSYKKSDYNETQTRRDFIVPFFKALGWDIDNEQGSAESYREVIHEDRVKVGKATKAPDYSFRLGGGQRLFFVEAKKPSVLIKDDIQPAYQVRRYGWSAKLNVSVITDFEEFAIYDCTKKPNATDKSSVARVKYLTFNEYEIEWDFLWDTFSKEAVLKGGFDKFIGGNANKKGTATVDKEFLLSLDQWRTLLAETISKENKQLSEDELNFVVQQTLDRIIFLRICEDRAIEPYGSLNETLTKGEGTYPNLLQLFKDADDKYNSGLFNFKKDKVSSQITINNKTLKTILNQLYYPACPYEFSVLSVEILGSAYEQFLGKTITINNRGKAVIELKPEVRKAGGVYYTPQYIVDYIVQNTVGKLAPLTPPEGGKIVTPDDVALIKIVDPACGSGSFLLGAYQYLLNWHIDYFTKNPKEAIKQKVFTPNGSLSTGIKKQILLNNIFGVDIDTNAVEVTKLSLLLKCMEGETQASIAHQMTMFKERVLPTLDDNIKSGNSLIDTDYYDNELDFGEERKIKPFNWQKAFPEVFNRNVEIDKTLPFKQQYNKVAELEKQTQEFIINIVSEPPASYGKKYNGGFDVVIGNPPYVQPNILDKSSQMYLFKKFQSTTDLYSMFIETALNILCDGKDFGLIVPSLFIKGVNYEKLRNLINDNCINFNAKEYGDGVFEKVKMPTSIILGTKYGNGNKVDHFANNSQIFNRIETIKLSHISNIRRGLEIGRDKLIENGKIKCLNGSSIDRYIIKNEKFISQEIFNQFSKDLDIFKSPKIIVRETGNTFFATIESENALTNRSIYNVKIANGFSEIFLLGIINSKLMKFYFKEFISPITNVFPKIRIAQLKELPFPLNYSQEKHDQIVNAVEQLLQLNKDLQSATLESKKEQLKSKIDYFEDKINELVYGLYELTEEEIKVVENVK